MVQLSAEWLKLSLMSSNPSAIILSFTTAIFPQKSIAKLCKSFASNT